MRWLGSLLVVLAALLWLNACSNDTPASDSAPEQEEEEPLLAAAPFEPRA